MKRFLICKGLILLIILFIVPFSSKAQPKPNYVDCTWWVHKPVLKTDSAALVKRNVKRIDLYELIPDGDGRYDTTHYGRWEVKITNGKVERSDWYGSTNDCYRMDQVIFGDNMVVEQRDCVPNTDECRLKIVSLIDKNNKQQVAETQNKTMVEDFYLFYKIKYEYKNELPASATYYTDKKDDSLYKKIVFKYT